jgi:hypothetical protein
MELRNPVARKTVKPRSSFPSAYEDWGAALRTAERACCCSAKPTVVVLLTVKNPAVPGQLVLCDLLLCGHHYRSSRSVLATMGATVTNGEGHDVTTNAWLD